MKIAVVGTGYVGLVTGVCLAKAGHRVSCVDIDKAKVARMQAGEVPIYEPGLTELFQEVLANKHLSVTDDLATGIDGAEVIFLALPTPPGADGSADLSAVLSVASQLGALLKDYTVVVDKSTVPVGTAERVSAQIAEQATVEFDVVSNPEFLREGKALEDFMMPDRIVIGANTQRARDVMHQVYESFIHKIPEEIVFMDIRSAEMTKYAANSFLAMKVSFMNEIANLCERLGADVNSVRLGIGPDQRIGEQFLRAGIGFGGSCFPKDVLALQQTAKQHNYDFKLLNSIIEVNTKQKTILVDKILAYYDGSVTGKHFAVWGLAFKPDTDDIREAPALEIIDALLAQGATVIAYDPEAMENAKRYYEGQRGVNFALDALSAAQDADALVITTEWTEFAQADLAALKAALAAPLIFDGRNLWEMADLATAGFEYRSIGR